MEKFILKLTITKKDGSSTTVAANSIHVDAAGGFSYKSPQGQGGHTPGEWGSLNIVPSSEVVGDSEK